MDNDRVVIPVVEVRSTLGGRFGRYVDSSAARCARPKSKQSKEKAGLPVQRGLTQLDAEVRAWQSKANCMGVDPELFFPERGASTREAKEVCRGCVVRDDCLEYALANGEKFGIWGGLSERERRKVRRARALARRAHEAVTA